MTNQKRPEPNWDHIPDDLTLLDYGDGRMGVSGTAETPEKFQFLSDYLSLLAYNREHSK